MSYNDSIVHVYQALISSIHNQYNRTLASLENIEHGFRQSLYCNGYLGNDMSQRQHTHTRVSPFNLRNNSSQESGMYNIPSIPILTRSSNSSFPNPQSVHNFMQPTTQVNSDYVTPNNTNTTSATTGIRRSRNNMESGNSNTNNRPNTTEGLGGGFGNSHSISSSPSSSSSSNRGARTRVRSRNENSLAFSASPVNSETNREQGSETMSTNREGDPGEVTPLSLSQPGLPQYNASGNTQNTQSTQNTPYRPGFGFGSSGFTFTTPSLSSLTPLGSFPARSPFNFLNEPSLSNMWNTFSTGIDRNIFDNLQPVIVRPTPEQIERATECLLYRDIENPQSSSCPISLEPFNDEDEVMRLNSCGHYFLKDKIMSWFQSHVHCPLCRFDIREGISESSASADPVDLGQDLSAIAEVHPVGSDGEEETEDEQPDHSHASTENNSLPISNSTTSTQTNERDRNTIPTAQNDISNLLEMLTSEVTNHINNARIGDSIHIELESHPIFITHRSPENASTSTSEGNNDNNNNQQQGDDQTTEAQEESQREGERDSEGSTPSSHIL